MGNANPFPIIWNTARNLFGFVPGSIRRFNDNDIIRESDLKINMFDWRYHYFTEHIQDWITELFDNITNNIINTFCIANIFHRLVHITETLHHNNGNTEMQFIVFGELFRGVFIDIPANLQIETIDPIFGDVPNLLENSNQYYRQFKNVESDMEARKNLINNDEWQGDDGAVLVESLGNRSNTIIEGIGNPENLINNNTNPIPINDLIRNHLREQFQIVVNESRNIRYLLEKLRLLVRIFDQNISIDLNYFDNLNCYPDQEWANWLRSWFVNLTRRGISASTTRSFYIQYRRQVVRNGFLTRVNREITKYNNAFNTFNNIYESYKRLQFRIEPFVNDGLNIRFGNENIIPINIGENLYQDIFDFTNDLNNIVSNNTNNRIRVIFHGADGINNEENDIDHLNDLSIVFMSNEPFVIENSSINRWIGLQDQPHTSQLMNFNFQNEIINNHIVQSDFVLNENYRNDLIQINNNIKLEGIRNSLTQLGNDLGQNNHIINENNN